MAPSTKEMSDAIESCRLLSREEACRLLKVSSTTLLGLYMRKQNPLPSVRMGKSRRFPFDKVRWWMENLGK